MTVTLHDWESVDDAKRMSNTDLVMEYLVWLRDVKRRSPLTVYTYEGELNRWLDWLEATHLMDAAPRMVEEFAGRPRLPRGCGYDAVLKRPEAATQAKSVATLSSLYDYLNARFGGRNPAKLAGKPQINNVDPKPVSDAIWRKVWMSPTFPKAPEYRIMMGLMYFCGLRRAECAAITANMIDFESKVIVGLPRKGGGQDVIEYGDLMGFWRKVKPELVGKPAYMLEQMIESIVGRRAFQAEKRGEALGDRPLLGWGMHYYHPKHGNPVPMVDPQMISKKTDICLSQCKITPAERFTPHQLRHSFVTNLLKNGVPLDVVSSLANHSDPKITMRYAKQAGRIKTLTSEATRFNRFTGENPSLVGPISGVPQRVDVLRPSPAQPRRAEHGVVSRLSRNGLDTGESVE